MILNIADMIAPTEEVTQTTGDGSDNDEHHTISTTEQARHRKSDKSYLKWTDDMLYYFVKECRNQDKKRCALASHTVAAVKIFLGGPAGVH